MNDLIMESAISILQCDFQKYISLKKQQLDSIYIDDKGKIVIFNEEWKTLNELIEKYGDKIKKDKARVEEMRYKIERENNED